MRFFKKYFIPHKDNDYKPHLLHTRKIVTILLAVILIEAVFLFEIFVVVPSPGFLAEVLPSVLVDATNSARAEEKLFLLRTNLLLSEAAKLKAEDMASRGYFSHNSPEGKTPWAWLNEVGYDFSEAGENLAVNFVDSEDVISAWLNSLSHRANILNQTFSEIGIATARGSYKGRDAIFVVQFFGRPRSKAAVAAKVEGVKVENPAFIKIEEMGQQKAISPAVPAEIKNESTPLEQALARPRTISNYALTFLAVFMALALALKIFINPVRSRPVAKGDTAAVALGRSASNGVKIRIQYPRLILNGLISLLIIFSVLFLNQYFALSEAAVF